MSVKTVQMSNRPLMLQIIRYFYDLFFQLPLCSDLNLVFVWCPYFHGYFLQLRVTSSALRIAFLDNWTPCPPLSIPWRLFPRIQFNYLCLMHHSFGYHKQLSLNMLDFFDSLCANTSIYPSVQCPLFCRSYRLSDYSLYMCGYIVTEIT